MNTVRFPRNFRFAFCLTLGLVIAGICPARAQEFVFTKIVDSNDPVPNGAGALFGIADGQPALDGGTVVFRNGVSSLAPTSIWSVTGGAFTKLVDLSTAVPGGTGNFSALILDFSAPGYPVLSNGTVVFAGRDSASSGYTGGLYSVPAAGGAISRIVNRNVAVPDGTGNFNGGLQFFSVDNGKVAFNGVDMAGSTGIYSANTNGTALTAIADSAHPAHPEFPFPIGNFNYPSVSGTTVAFYGNGTFDPSNGYNALYTTSTSGGFTYVEPATSLEPLPGDSNGAFHTRFGTPRLDGDTIFFRADDANTTNPNFFGLFSVAKGGGAFSNLVDLNDTLPGLTNVNGNSLTAYAANGGTLVFTALDDSGNYGLYTHVGSTIGKVIATGDYGPFADLHATAYAPSIGNEAVSDGSLVFYVAVRFSAAGIYLATPISLSADLATSLSVAPANAGVGTDATLDVDVTNNGPASAQTVTVVVTLPPGLAFKSAVGGVFDAAANTVTFSVASIASGVTKSFSVVATVEASGPLTASAYANSATADSDRQNNHAFATTDDIFASSGNWVIRSLVINNVTPVPDRPGTFFVTNGGLDPLPALDGGKVAFIAVTGSLTSVWSVNADGSGDFQRLADTDTLVPGGAGEKFGYMKSLGLRNGNVVFLGYGADGVHDGIYTVPVTGGTVKAVVASGSPRPEGTGANFGYQDFIQSFNYGYLGDGQMTFTAGSGAYAYPAAGGGTGHVLVYPGSNIPVAGNIGEGLFLAPAISGTRAVFSANAALLGVNLDERRYFAVADTATASPSTPGMNFVLGTQDSFAGAQIEGETVAFTALSGTNASIVGLYSITGNGPAVKLVDTNTDVPGGNGKFSGFTSAGSPPPGTLGLSDGEVVFLGADADNRAGLYSVSAAGGTITKIVAVGDTVNGLQITGTPGFFQPPFQPNSLGEHQIAFRADFFNPTSNTSGTGIFVAGRVENRLANISTRLAVGTDDSALIGGLIISGTSPKSVLIRGIGPSLGTFGVPDVLADPTLELFDGAGQSITTNDNWRDTQEQEIMDTNIPPTNDLESAILATLDPGNYTAVLRGKNNTTGNALVEVYDLAASTDLDTRLINISTRGFVQAGDNVMIGGLIVQGAAEKHLLVRAIGPSLGTFGVPTPLADPTLEVVDASGTTLASDDNWRDTQEQAIIDSTIPPNDDLESAIDIHLMPGNYTAIVRGKNNTTGNALVEVYELP